MSSDPDKKPLALRIQIFFARARFFTMSALMHVILVVLGGSAVLFHQTTPVPDFEAGEGEIVASELVESGPPDPPKAEQQLAQMEPETPQISAPSLSTITTANVSTAFAVSSAPVAKLDAKLLGTGDDGKKIGEKLAGMGGGGGRIGGMRSGMIFGKKVEASKLGVILDVSGSAHPHLAVAITEIQKGFKDATIILYPGCGLIDSDRRSEHEIRKYSTITQRDLEKTKGNFTTPTQLTKALKIEEFEKMTKRTEVRDALFVSWYNEDGENSAKLIGQAQVAFDELFKRGADSIYWFADFADRVDAETVEKISSELKKRKITLHVHNFAGKAINPLVTTMAEKTGGTVNTEKPK